MTPEDTSRTPSGSPPDEVLTAFLQACDSGDVEKQAEILAARPEWAADLEGFREHDEALGAAFSVSATDFPPGGMPFGPYRLLSRIRRGSLGTVFKALRDGTEDYCALKILDCDPDSTRKHHVRFAREIETLRKFDHPNIVPAVDSGEIAGYPYITMPWIDGADLRAIIEVLRDQGGEPELPTEVCAEGQTSRLGWSDPDAHVRSVALIGIQAAEALWYAHGVGLDGKAVLHRDVKPSNLMLDRTGKVFLIDFGLAHWQDGETMTESIAPVGALLYMAPERLIGNIGPRSDIYSLGLVLYELLTLRKPFDERLNLLELSRQIEESSPPNARGVRRSIPKDLDRIILHAIEKDPVHRYVSAKEMADDLRCFVTGKHVPRRSPRLDQRAWSRIRRHPKASAAAAVAIAILALCLTFYVRLLDARARVAEFQLQALRERDRESRFQGIRARIGLTLDGSHEARWTKRLDALVDQAAKLSDGADISDLVIASCVATDLVLDYALEDFGASSVAFAVDGSRLVIGGMSESGPRKEPRPARLIDLQTKRVIHTSKAFGSGQVVFDREHRPLQFYVPERGKAVVWDIKDDRAIATFPYPAAADVAASCISADGSMVALAITNGSGSGEVLVWEVAGGHLHMRHDGSASSLAFSPDTGLFALGDLAGRILVREITSGRTVFELPERPRSVRAMAFGRNPLGDASARHGWILAEGEGGAARIWDVSTRQVQAFCESVPREVNSLSFSSDGTVLAGGGDGFSIWDAGNGKLILTSPAIGSKVSGIAFSPKDSQLAVVTNMNEGCFLWALKNGRGLKLLRGLSGSVSSLSIAQNRNLVAALASNRRVGVWDAETGQLLFVRHPNVTRRSYNAGVDINPTGDLLVFHIGEIIELWEGATGRELKRWVLSESLFDGFAFPSAGGLLSVRLETRDGRNTPFDNHDPASPNVWRIRNLRETYEPIVLGEIAGHEGRVDGLAIKDEGDLMLVLAERRDCYSGRRLVLTAYELPSRRRLWTMSDSERDVRYFSVDPTWTRVAVHYVDSTDVQIVDPTTGRALESWRGVGSSKTDVYTLIGPGGTHLRWNDSGGYAPDFHAARFAMFRDDTGLLFEFPSTLIQSLTPRTQKFTSKEFTRDGRFLLIAMNDGHVLTADLDEISRRLEQFKTGWVNPREGTEPDFRKSFGESIPNSVPSRGALMRP